MKSNLNNDQSILCDVLYEIGAIKFGGFKLKLHDLHPEAPPSPIYCDLRVVQRFPDVYDKVIDFYCRMLSGMTFEVLAGIPVAATTFTATLKEIYGVGMVTPRMETKTHGTGTKVDGGLDSDVDTLAALIDDLVTKADSKIQAAEILRDCGFVVEHVFVLIDRSTVVGREQLAHAGLTLHAAIKLDDMLRYYLETGKIDEDIYQDTLYRLDLLSQYQ